MLIEGFDGIVWDNVLRRCPDWDIYHTFGYHLVDVRVSRPYLFDNEHGGAIPFIVHGLEARSVYGYPGFIGNWDEYDFAMLEEEFKTLGVRKFSTRLHPIINKDLSLAANNWEVEQVGTTVAIDLNGPGEVSKGHKADIKKAKANGLCAVIYDYSNIGVFHRQYTETMRRAGAKERYFFPIPYFMRLKQFFGDKIMLWAAEDSKGEAVATAIIIGKPALLSQYGFLHYHLAGTPDKNIADGGQKIIIDGLIRLGRRFRAYRWFHLGGGLGGSEDDPLFRFKAGFSKHRFPFRIARWKA